MIKYKLVNSEDIPKNLDPTKQYTTEVVSGDWDVAGNLIIQLKFIGEEYDSENPQTLFAVNVTDDYFAVKDS